MSAVYLQQFPSYSNHNCEKNRHFYVPRPSFFVFPGDAPAAIMQTLHGWKDNSVLAKPLAACTHLSLTVSQLFEPQVQKITVLTYRSPHFCFPWGRPWGNHAKCCMDKRELDAYKLSRCMCPSNYTVFQKKVHP